MTNHLYLWPIAFSKLIEHEGEIYKDDPDDPGGGTKYGIAKKFYPNVDIPNLTKEKAEAIYLRDYWHKYRCGELPSAIALVLFDGVVNQNGKSVVKYLQKALGVTQDGIMGDETVNVAQSTSSNLRIAREVLSYRLRRYAMKGVENNNLTKYIRGWSLRALDTYHECFLVEYGMR